MNSILLIMRLYQKQTTTMRKLISISSIFYWCTLIFLAGVIMEASLLFWSTTFKWYSINFNWPFIENIVVLYCSIVELLCNAFCILFPSQLLCLKTSSSLTPLTLLLYKMMFLIIITAIVELLYVSRLSHYSQFNPIY